MIRKSNAIIEKQVWSYQSTQWWERTQLSIFIKNWTKTCWTQSHTCYCCSRGTFIDIKNTTNTNNNKENESILSVATQEGVAYVTWRDISARGVHFSISKHTEGNVSHNLLLFIVSIWNKIYKTSRNILMYRIHTTFTVCASFVARGGWGYLLTFIQQAGEM